jgi:hypothetical protein
MNLFTELLARFERTLDLTCGNFSGFIPHEAEELVGGGGGLRCVPCCVTKLAQFVYVAPCFFFSEEKIRNKAH